MTYAFIQYSLWRYLNESSLGMLALVADSSANQSAIHKFFTNLQTTDIHRYSENLYFELHKKQTKWMVGCQFIPRVHNVCTCT